MEGKGRNKRQKWTYNEEGSRWKRKIASFLQDIACSHFMLLWASNVKAKRYRKMFSWETFNDENDTWEWLLKFNYQPFH